MGYSIGPDIQCAEGKCYFVEASARQILIWQYAPKLKLLMTLHPDEAQKLADSISLHNSYYYGIDC